MIIKTDCWQMNVSDDITPAHLIDLKMKRDHGKTPSKVIEPKDYYSMVRNEVVERQELLDFLKKNIREERSFPLNIIKLRVQMLRAKISQRLAGTYDKSTYRGVEELCKDGGPIHKDRVKQFQRLTKITKDELARYKAELESEGR